jgi:hypothetical protein
MFLAKQVRMTTEVTEVPLLITVGTLVTGLACPPLLDGFIAGAPRLCRKDMLLLVVRIAFEIRAHAFYNPGFMKSFAGVIVVPLGICSGIIQVLSLEAGHRFDP